jgi:pectinesterase
MERTMRILLLHIIIFLLTAVGLAGVGSFTKEKSVAAKVTNALDLNRPNEIVVLNCASLQKYLQVISCDNICVYDARTSDTLVTQLIDEDQNGIPEEIIFCTNFKARETKQFVIKAVNKQIEAYQSLTFAKLMIPREDLAWENDRNAFRIYGPPLAKDVNNGIDVWTKRVRYPIVEKWYKGDEAPDSVRIPYHEDHGEGADFFSVGRTLGAGGSALYSNGSLYQPGVFTASRILAAGPLRTMFEVTYKPVEFNGRNISEVKRFTLDEGSNLNKIEVTYICDSSNNTVQFAAGLVKRKDVKVYYDKKNQWISLWGLTNEKEENGSLGTGIIMSKKAFNGISEDSVHVLLLGKAKLGIPSVYYAGAGWTRSGDINNADEWNNYLKEFSLRLNSPLKIKILKK